MVAGAVDSRLPQVLVEMARSQRDRVPALSVELADLLAEKAACYREIADPTPEELRKVCEVHLALAFTAFIEGRDDALRIVARKTGHAQAKLGIPLEDALRAYWIAGTFCWIARRCLPSGARGVVAFGDLPIAALVAGAPRLAGDLARDVLGGVLALPPGEREVLLKTLEAWYTDGGSAKAAAGRLYVHLNTVRYRLRRIEDLTGRDLAHPKRVAELYVALQAVRLGTGNRNAGERTG